MNLIERTIGVNWRTALTGIGAAFTGLLTVMAALPYELGDVASIIPPEYKAKLAVAGAVSTAILRVMGGLSGKDKQVTGGSVQQPEEKK